MRLSSLRFSLLALLVVPLLGFLPLPFGGLFRSIRSGLAGGIAAPGHLRRIEDRIAGPPSAVASRTDIAAAAATASAGIGLLHCRDRHGRGNCQCQRSQRGDSVETSHACSPRVFEPGGPVAHGFPYPFTFAGPASGHALGARVGTTGAPTAVEPARFAVEKWLRRCAFTPSGRRRRRDTAL